MATQYHTHTTRAIVPETGIITTKIVSDAIPGETEAQRERRLGKQYAANGGHIKFLGGLKGSRSWSVPSQRRDSQGQAVTHYQVCEVNGELMCGCDFGQWHPGKACGHTAQVSKWIERKEREEFRALAAPITWTSTERKARGRTEPQEEL